MSIDAILFDLDNTLVNRKLAFHTYTEKLIDTFLIETNASERTRMINYIREADRDGYRSKKEFYNELSEQLKWKSEPNIDSLLDYWFSEFFKCTVLMDGAIEIIKFIKEKEMKLGIITNGSIHTQNAKIDQVNLRRYFDTIIVSDEVQIKKPDRKIFELALEKLNVKPDRAIYIGDHPMNDIEGARTAGLHTVWLQGFKEWDELIEKPNYVITQLKELENIIRGEKNGDNKVIC